MAFIRQGFPTSPPKTALPAKASLVAKSAARLSAPGRLTAQAAVRLVKPTTFSRSPPGSSLTAPSKVATGNPVFTKVAVRPAALTKNPDPRAQLVKSKVMIRTTTNLPVTSPTTDPREPTAPNVSAAGVSSQAPSNVCELFPDRCGATPPVNVTRESVASRSTPEPAQTSPSPISTPEPEAAMPTGKKFPWWILAVAGVVLVSR